jgi:hypothetical protein
MTARLPVSVSGRSPLSLVVAWVAVVGRCAWRWVEGGEGRYAHHLGPREERFPGALKDFSPESAVEDRSGGGGSGRQR